MIENLPAPTTGISEEPSSAAKPLRLKFPIGVVVVFWALRFAVGGLEKPYFYAFLLQMASVGLFTLLFLGWWWFNRGLRLSEKLFGFGVIVFGAVITGTLTHRSINGWTLFLSGLPLVMTFVVGWML